MKDLQRKAVVILGHLMCLWFLLMIFNCYNYSYFLANFCKGKYARLFEQCQFRRNVDDGLFLRGVVIGRGRGGVQIMYLKGGLKIFGANLGKDS